jgi:hypothetical protein
MTASLCTHSPGGDSGPPLRCRRGPPQTEEDRPGPFNWFATFAAAVLLASLLGCAATPKYEGSGEYFDDILTTKVKTAMFNAGRLKSSKINVVLAKVNVSSAAQRFLSAPCRARENPAPARS